MAKVAVRRSVVGNGLLTDLLAYWPLSEAAGNPRVNLAVTAVGAWTETGNVGAQAGKVYATAADWPADESEADYLTIAVGDRGEIATAVGAEVSRTIAFWMYCYAGSDTAAQYKGIWYTGGANQWEGGEQIRINQEPKVWCIWGDGAGVGGHNSGSVHGPNVTLSSWELWIVEQDAVNDHVTIYKWPTSGVEAQAETAAWPYGQANHNTAMKLCWPDSNGNAQQRIGPLMVWGRVLTPQQRAQLWNGGAGLTYAQFTE